MEYNPDLLKAWNDHIGPWNSGLDPEEALPLWNAFKSGWEARLKYDLNANVTVTSNSENFPE